MGSKLTKDLLRLIFYCNTMHDIRPNMRKEKGYTQNYMLDV